AFAVNLINGDAVPDTNDTFRLAPVSGDPTAVKIFINNNTATPNYVWTFSSGQQLILNGLGGNDTLIAAAPLAMDVVFNGGAQTSAASASPGSIRLSSMPGPTTAARGTTH